jgi:hypothetical protein
MNEANLRKVMEQRGWQHEPSNGLPCEYWYRRIERGVPMGFRLWEGEWQAGVDFATKFFPTLRQALDWINVQLVTLKLKGDV